ncbi:MAG TPA: hypothetical protein PKD85_02605 [Saprospiraceae bacterium]|nr:hypothetical protein [Saprospiraceae bacterium]
MDKSAGMNISSFIPRYPNIEDPNFNYDILRKVEFYDLRLKSFENKPEHQGELLDSQKILQRFFAPETPYNKSLFFHDPGTGKCIHPDTLLNTHLGLQKASNLWDWFSDEEKHDGVGIWSELKVNVMVKSYNEDEKKFEDMDITRLYRQYINENMKKVVLACGNSIDITFAHKLYIDGNVWTNNYKVGDSVMLEDGATSKISNIIIYNYEGWVYDFEVQPHHNYVANGILCHNTCLLSSIVESSKHLEVGGKQRKRALIIVKNDGLRRKLIKDVATVCTDGIYLPKHSAKEMRKGLDMTEDAKTRRIKAEIIKTYEIVTIETFLKNLPTDNAIIEKEYSNRDILIDEAHVLRIQASSKSGDSDDPKISSKQYKKMHRFLHIVQNCRILLFTGTPIWDNTSEIGSLMNLILDDTEQLPTGKEFDKEFFDNKGTLKEAKIPKLKELFKGKISYLRKMMTTAKREEIGTSEPWLQYVKVFPDKMSKIQSLYVKNAHKTDDNEVASAFSRDARDASNMIIPIFDSNGEIEDYAYGKAAFKKYATTTRKTLKGEEGGVIYKISNKFLENYIKTSLYEISTKFSSVIEDIKAHPNEIVFIYNEFVTGVGGAIMLALCLELHGLVWIKNASQMSKPSAKSRRFAVITSEKGTTNQATQIEELLESSNKPDNKYGDRLQVIIGSEKIALGMDIKNVRRIHAITPYWNMPSLDQAMARGFRFGGHDALPKEERYIKVFKHVAVEGGGKFEFAEDVGYPTNKGFSDKSTIDIHVYDIAEKKEYKNTQIYRVLKEVSYDCGLFYKRNVLETDVDGSRECDYQKCKYKCDGLETNKKYPDDPYRLPKTELDYSTFNLLYSEPYVKIMIDSIVELFRNYFSLDIYAIQQLLDITDENRIPTLIEALDIIIDTRIEIRDRFGFGQYLKEDGNVYFLDTKISGTSRYLESVYVENPLVSEITSLESLVDIMELQNDVEPIKEFCKDPSDDTLNKISYKSKIILLETAYKRKLLKESLTEAEDILLEEMGDDIYTMSDDTSVHILYSSEFKGTSFDIAAKKLKASGEMKYFDMDDKEWKNMTDIDLENQYLEEIKLVDLEEDKLFENNKYNVYGIVSKKDNKFRIRLKPEEGKRTSGLVCSSHEESDLRDLFVVNLKKFPKINSKYKKLEKEKLIQIIKGIPGSLNYRKGLASKDEKYLRGLLTILTLSKTELCKALREIFNDLGILYNK